MSGTVTYIEVACTGEKRQHTETSLLNRMAAIWANGSKVQSVKDSALKDAKKIFDERAAVFLDSRSSADYRDSHIQGARELPLVSLVQNRDLADKIIPDKTAPYIVYCSGEGCDLSVELAKELISLGYFNIKVLGEGYPGWAEARYPVESSR